MINDATKHQWLTLAVTIMVIASPRAHADRIHIVVIASKRAWYHALSLDALHDIYLKKIFIDRRGYAYIPVNLPPVNPLRGAFLSVITQLDQRQLEKYWDHMYFQGTSPPYVLGSQAAVVDFVATTPGSIGYVQACHVNSAVRIVQHFTINIHGVHKCNTAHPTTSKSHL